jgi:hypothetical protein
MTVPLNRDIKSHFESQLNLSDPEARGTEAKALAASENHGGGPQSIRFAQDWCRPTPDARGDLF